MKTIIAGSRGITDSKLLLDALAVLPWTITEVVSGAARGVDQMGEVWAIMNDVKLTKFPADWDKYGKRAGFVRNTQMAEYAEALLALWDGKSNGTRHMISEARARNFMVKVVTL